MYRELPKFMHITINRVVSIILDLIVPLSLPVIDGNGGSVKMCWSEIVHSWAAPVLQTFGISSHAFSAT